MNIKHISIILFFLQMSLFSQTFQWGGHFKHTDYHGLQARTKFILDSQNNVYIIGETSTSLFDLNPNVIGEDIVSVNGIKTYLVKLNQDGSYAWGILFDNSYTFLNLEIGQDNNIYAYFFTNQLNTTNNVIDSFMSRYKITTNGVIVGNFNFLLNYGFQDGVNVTGISFDQNNNYYMYGYTTGNVSIGNESFSNVPNNKNYFVVKFNFNNQLQWTKKIILPISGSIPNYCLDIDSNNNIHIQINVNLIGFKTLKLNSLNGNIEQEFNLNLTIYNSKVLNDKIVIFGIMNETVIDVDPSNNDYLISGLKKIILFFDLNYNLEKVFTIQEGIYTYEINSFSEDNNNNFYICGYAHNLFDFNLNDNQTNLINLGFKGNAFIMKINNLYQHDDLILFGQPNPYTNIWESCWNLGINQLVYKDNDLYLSGRFRNYCDFDMSTINNFTLSSAQGALLDHDGFIAKYSPCTQSAPIINNNQIFCSSTNPKVLNLIPNSNTYVWYDSLTSNTPLNPNLQLQNNLTYYCAKVINNCPESNRTAVLVNIIDIVPSPISSNQIFCESENATISNIVISGQNVKWYPSINSTNQLPVNYLLQNNTSYYASQTINGCESERVEVNITINSVPLPTLLTPQKFCTPQNATINSVVINGQNIKWYDTSIGGNLLSNNTILINSQTYYATQTINNCESLRVPVLINIQNTPTPVGASTQTFCSIQNPTLADIVVNGSNLKWYNSNSSLNPIPISTTLVNGTTYYVSQTINNCESIIRLPITITLISNLNANDFSDKICDNLNDNSEIINLSNYNSSLITNTSNCTFAYYQSLTGATNQTNSDLISNFSSYNLTGNHDLFVRITSTNGCHQIVKLSISLVKSPIISIDDILPICENKNITLNAGNGFNTYLWSNGLTSQSITISQAGNYFVTVTKNYGNTICSSTKNFKIVFSNIAKIASIETQDWTDNDNVVIVNVTSNSYGIYEYSIDGINYQDSNVFYGLSSGDYLIYVRDKNGCGISKDDIYLLMYPKFFTPNGDGYNDTWSIKFSFTEPKLKVNIFDRYGKLIKILNHKSSWDGKYDGNILPSSDYWFVVTRENGKEYKGHFTLKR